MNCETVSTEATAASMGRSRVGMLQVEPRGPTFESMHLSDIGHELCSPPVGMTLSWTAPFGEGNAGEGAQLSAVGSRWHSCPGRYVPLHKIG